MAGDNSIEQGEKLARFLSGLDDFIPGTGELAGDAAIRVIGERGALIASLKADVDAQRQILDGARPPVDADIARIAELEAENAELSVSLKAVKGHETRAKNALAVLRAECSPTPRKVGRPRAAFGKPGEAYSPELAAIAIGGDEHVEIVFSDGKAEITSLPPVTAYPQAWLQTGGRHMLREPIELEGGDGDIEVAGFALLSGGEQVGWRELPDPIRVPKNGRVRLENCITF